VLVDGFERIRGLVHHVLNGLGPDELTYRLDAEANTIAWLVWHLTRVQDDHVADASGSDQVWIADGWVERFALPFDARATGYGQDSDEVSAVRVSPPSLLAEYHDAAHARTAQYLASLTDADLDRVVDRSWDPPVTLGVRLLSVVADDLQHVGQAALVRGVVTRR
jgi:uncharacterized protein DUF664